MVTKITIVDKDLYTDTHRLVVSSRIFEERAKARIIGEMDSHRTKTIAVLPNYDSVKAYRLVWEHRVEHSRSQTRQADPDTIPDYDEVIEMLDVVKENVYKLDKLAQQGIIPCRVSDTISKTAELRDRPVPDYPGQ